MRPVRIGAGLGASGRLSDEAMARGMETLGVFAAVLRANGLAPSASTVATSAIREAANGEQFLADAAADRRSTIEVLSAEEEARYGYVAAVNTSTLTDGVVLEIGGGSLQLIQVAVAARRPVLVPARRRALHRAVPSRDGPARKEDLAPASRVMCAEHAPGRLTAGLLGVGPRLVGIGGAVRNLAAAAQTRRRAARPWRPGLRDHAGRRWPTWCSARRAAASERGMVPGIKPGRGDIILAAALVLETVIELGDFDGIEATEAGLRDGVFLARTLLAGRPAAVRRCP